MMDNGVEADIDAITRNVDEAEVVTFYFPILGKTLLIDTRWSEHVGPMVRIVPMADSSAERLRSLRRLRPELPRPTSLTFIPWNRSVASLTGLGVWEHITRRFADHRDAARYGETAGACLARLRALEARELRSAVTGERYHTIWTRDACDDDA
jgi:hypothetical protein